MNEISLETCYDAALCDADRVAKSEQKPKYLFEDETYKIRGALFEVFSELGSGFLESVYQECLEKEFGNRGIPFTVEPEIYIRYKGELLKSFYKPDFLCFDTIIIEIKAVKELNSEHRAQILNYLKATKKPLGLLVNFCSHPKIQIERYVLNEK